MKAHKVFEYEEGFVIIMPYCSQGTLAQLKPDPTELKDAIRQILEALSHLHGLNCIHRDIKPGNVLVSNLKGERLHVVVADYGLMTSEIPVTFAGTLGYMAPEILRNGEIHDESKRPQYLNKVDIYALGILILRMLDIKIPEHRIDTQKHFTKYVKKLVAEESDKCGEYDFDRYDVLTVADRMLQFAPIIRPSADECLQLPCLEPATAAPAALPWSSSWSSTSVSTTRSGGTAPAKSLGKNYWDSTGVNDQVKFRKQSKGRRPKPTVPKSKVYKKGHNPLPTPGTTPLKGHKARESEEGEPDDAEMVQDASSPVSCCEDEKPLSD